MANPVVRNPHRRITAVVNGFMPILPRKVASTSSPDWNASSPKPIWNSSGSRNGAVLIVTRKIDPPTITAAKVGTRITDRSSRGWRGRAARAGRPTTPIAAPASSSSGAAQGGPVAADQLEPLHQQRQRQRR